MPVPSVVGVHLSPRHGFSKAAAETIELHEGLGVAGDAHYGTTVQHRSRLRRNPDEPNLRQVHLLPAEVLADLAGRGFAVTPGQLGENVTTSGVDLLGLPVGTRLRLGDDAVVTVTGLRNPCRQIDGLSPGLLALLVRRDGDRVVRLAGVMGIVSRSGTVRAGDPVRMTLPPEPHRPLTTV